MQILKYLETLENLSRQRHLEAITYIGVFWKRGEFVSVKVDDERRHLLHVLDDERFVFAARVTLSGRRIRFLG